MAEISTLADRLAAAPRSAVLSFIAEAIHALTIHARYYYDEPDRYERMRETNEAIHRLAGHMRDLVSAEVPLTTSRIDSIVGHAGLLPPHQLIRVDQRNLDV